MAISHATGRRLGARHYSMLGAGFSVGGADEVVLDEIDRLLRVFSAGTEIVEVTRRYELGLDSSGTRWLRVNGEIVARSPSGATLIDALLIDANHEAIESFDGLAVHAGVVAASDAVLAFPGVSGRGKSTLTAACVAAGFAYVSDEALCLNGVDGRVVAYPKPIALEPRGWALVGRPEPAARAVGAGVKVMMNADELARPVRDAAGPLHLAHVLQLERRPGVARLVQLPRTAAVRALLSMSFNHYKDPARAFALASRVAADARTWRLEYSDPRAAAALLFAEFGS